MTTVWRCPLNWFNSNRYFAIVIENLLPKEDCLEMLQRVENQGFETALVNIGGGQQVLATDVRNSDRCIMDDPDTAEKIWQRILIALKEFDDDVQKQLGLEYLYSPSDGWSPVGLNERLRFLQYSPGQYFRPHSDGVYVRNGNDLAGKDRRRERSFVTCLLFLNDCPAGGETAFHGPGFGETFKIPCRTGTAILFEHDLVHEGCQIRKGHKHVMRSDVMYTQKGPGNEYSKKPIALPSAKNASDSFDENLHCI